MWEDDHVRRWEDDHVRRWLVSFSRARTSMQRNNQTAPPSRIWHYGCMRQCVSATKQTKDPTVRNQQKKLGRRPWEGEVSGTGRCICKYVYVYRYIYIYIYIYMQIHVYIHIYIYIHIFNIFICVYKAAAIFLTGLLFRASHPAKTQHTHIVHRYFNTNC